MRAKNINRSLGLGGGWNTDNVKLQKARILEVSGTSRESEGIPRSESFGGCQKDRSFPNNLVRLIPLSTDFRANLKRTCTGKLEKRCIAGEKVG